jgi:hypothetical protein
MDKRLLARQRAELEAVEVAAFPLLLIKRMLTSMMLSADVAGFTIPTRMLEWVKPIHRHGDNSLHYQETRHWSQLDRHHRQPELYLLLPLLERGWLSCGMGPE